MRKYPTLLFTFILAFTLKAQKPYSDEYQSRYKNLYEGAIPNSKTTQNKQKTVLNKDNYVFTTEISTPTIARFDPLKNLKNGTAVIICPGGGYWGTADKQEGTDVAKMLNSWGITAFVLRYRMPDSATMIDSKIGPLQDAQYAIRWVRKNAKKWNLKENRIGIMGFSAGGHLAATASTHFQTQTTPSVLDSISARPDFSMLIYPVISLKSELTHAGSRDKLLGKNASLENIKSFSNEEQVTEKTPPTFLVHSADDKIVPVENSLEYYKSCLKNKVPVEMHLYPKGGHGYGMNIPNTNDKWTERLHNWLKTLNFLKP